MRRGETTLRHLLVPIQDLLDARDITEIVCQREGEVGFEQNGQWLWRHVPELTYRRLDAIGLLAGNFMGKKFDPANPICSTFLPDGQRFTLCRAPVTDAGVIAASIRLPPRQASMIADGDFVDLMAEAKNRADRGPGPHDQKLLELHRAKAWREFFPLAVKTRKTIGATGRVMSGKTTFLRRIMQEIPPDDRLITIEDSPEFLDLPVRNRVSLYYGERSGVAAEECVETTLRMRPDRVALQECRSAEAMAFIRLQASGHSGSFTSWHADEGDPWTPLLIMAKTSQAGRNLPDDKLLAILRGFIDVIVYCERSQSGRFTVPSVYFRGATQ